MPSAYKSPPEGPPSAASPRRHPRPAAHDGPDRHLQRVTGARALPLDLRVGLLINFHELVLKNGIKRIVNDYRKDS